MFTFAHGNPKVQLDQQHTALVQADIQDECLADIGSCHPMIEDKLKENCVADHLEQLLQ